MNYKDKLQLLSKKKRIEKLKL